MTATIGRAGLALGVVGLLAGTLTGCGGGSSATNPAPAAATGAQASGAQASGAPNGAAGLRRQFFDPAMQKKIAQCLEAAGLPVPSFSPRPSGERPSGSFPNGVRPTGPRPTGTGGFRGPYSDPKVRAALEACGIQLPTFRPDGPGGAGGRGEPGGPGDPGGSGAPQGPPPSN